VAVAPGVFPGSRLREGFHDGYQSIGPDAHERTNAFRSDEISAFASGFALLPGQIFGGQLQVGGFAGYAQTHLHMGPIKGSARTDTDYGSEASNGSFVGGGYALYTGGVNYAMLTLSGNVGQTEQNSLDPSGVSESSYGTSGFVGSFVSGHVFDLTRSGGAKDLAANRDLKLDLRGGLSYQAFHSGQFIDPASQTLQAETDGWTGSVSATMFTMRQWGEGTVRPYVKGEVRQQLSYDNTVYVRDINPKTYKFDQSGTMGVVELGFDYALKNATFSAAVYGDHSGDQTGVGGRLALKFKLNETESLK
jgi:hypothetical protein